MNARIICRIEDFEIGKRGNWKPDMTAARRLVQLKQNEDFITTNEELIQLLKRKVQEVETENTKLRDKRSMWNRA